MLRSSLHRAFRFATSTVSLGVLAVALLGSSTAGAVLNVSVEARPDPVRPGETIHVVVHLANESALNVGSGVLSVTLPSQIVAFSEIQASGSTNCNAGLDASLCEPGETMVSAFGTLVAGQRVTFEFSAVVASGGAAPADGTVLTFAALGSATAQTSVNASGTVVVDSTSALDLTLEPDHDPALPGEALTYRLHFANKSGGSLANVLLSAPVPAGASFLSASDGGALNGSNVEWLLGTLPAGASGARSFQVSIGGGLAAGSRLVASATLSGGAPLRTARAVETVWIHATPELEVRLLPSVDPIAVGDRETTTIIAVNQAATNAGGVFVVLRLPEWIEAFAENALVGSSNCDRGANASVCEPGEAILWSLGTLPVGQARHLVMPPLVRSDGFAPSAGELASLHVTMSDSGNRYATARSSFAVASPATVALSIEPDRSIASPGDTIRYRLRYGNRALAAVSPATVVEAVLPPGSAFVSATGGGAPSGDRVVWSIGSLAAGDSGEVALNVAVSGTAFQGQSIEVRGRVSNGSGQEARTSSHVRVRSTNELEVRLELAADPLAPNERFTTNVTVSNPTVTNAGGVFVTLTLPDDIVPFSELQLIGTANCDRGANSSLCEPGESILWSFGTLVVGESRVGSFSTLVQTGVAAPPAGDQLRFVAIASDSGNRSGLAIDAVPIDAVAPLTLSLVDDRDPVESGGRIQYRVDVGNRAAAALAPNVQVEVTLPVGATFVEASDGGVLVGDVVRWLPGDLAAGASRAFSFSVDASASLASGSLVTAQARAFDGSSPASRSSSTQRTRIVSTPSLQTTLEVHPDPAEPGERIHVIMSVANATDTNSGGVFATVQLPDGIEAFPEILLMGGANCDRGLDANVCEPGEFILWSFGTLFVGQSSAGEFSTRIASGTAPGELVRFEAAAFDSGNRTTTTTRSLPVEANGRLTLAIDDEYEPVAPGENLVYRLTFANTAGAYVTSPGTAVSMPIPLGTTFVSASDGGVLVGNTVEWNVGLLRDLPDDVTLTVHVDPALRTGTLLRASARLTNAFLPTPRARAVAATRVETAPGLTLSVAAVPNVVGPNRVIDLSFTTVNDSGTNSGGVALFARMPEYIVPFPEPTLQVCNCDRGANPSTCEPGEQVFCSLGTVLAGATIVRTMTLQLVDETATHLPKGEVIRFEATSTDSGNRESVATRSLPEPGIGVGLAVGALALARAVRRQRSPSRNARGSDAR